MAARHFSSNGDTGSPRAQHQAGSPREGGRGRGKSGLPASEYFAHLGTDGPEDHLAEHMPLDPEREDVPATGYIHPVEGYVRPNETRDELLARNRRRQRVRRRRVTLGVVGGVCAVAIVAGLALSPGCSAGVDDGSGNAASNQQTTATGVNLNANQTEDAQQGAAVQSTSATDILGTLSALQHAGADCSLPTDGAEVDVQDGRVLVAFESGDTSEGTISRMASAAVALAGNLAGSSLSNSSTAEGGVSTVPAASTPAAIAASDGSTGFSSVEVVALGAGRYVISTITLSSADGLADASESQILSAADGYAIDGSAYRYSGLGSGVEQTKGDAPTLLTGEAITINLTAPRASQGSNTSSGSASSNANGSAASNGTTGSTSRSSNANRTNGSSTSTGTSATTSQRTSTGSGTGYSYGGSGTSTYDYSYDSYDSDAGTSASGSTDTGSGSASSSGSVYSDSGSTSTGTGTDATSADAESGL